MGCFADMGWAWNRKPSRNLVGKIALMPSAEFVESAVICFYGLSNVFLERLANRDGKWAAIDLEHISITLIFFGGGLVSLLSFTRVLLVSRFNPWVDWMPANTSTLFTARYDYRVDLYPRSAQVQHYTHQGQLYLV